MSLASAVTIRIARRSRVLVAGTDRLLSDADGDDIDSAPLDDNLPHAQGDGTGDTHVDVADLLRLEQALAGLAPLDAGRCSAPISTTMVSSTSPTCCFCSNKRGQSQNSQQLKRVVGAVFTLTLFIRTNLPAMNTLSTHSSNPTHLPVLYSFRRCPYAIRARMALRVAGVNVVLREVDLGARPAEMVLASPKGSVPVLVLQDDIVIDESLDIMNWALGENDPMDWLNTRSTGAHELIATNDGEFKHHLDRYKYPQWHEGAVKEEHRTQAERFLQTLEQRLTEHDYLDSDQLSILDAAIVPFIRQFAAVDQDWFADSPYPALRQWLAQILQGDDFLAVMGKQPMWINGDTPVLFP